MSLGIQWTWAQPVDFSHLNDEMNYRQDLAQNLGKAAGVVQGLIKDAQAKKIMSGEDIKEAEAELAKLKARLPEIDKEIAEVKQEMANVAGNTASAGMEGYKPLEANVPQQTDDEKYAEGMNQYNNDIRAGMGGYR